MALGGMPRSSRRAMRCVMTRVLPEPGAGQDEERPVLVLDRAGLGGVQRELHV